MNAVRRRLTLIVLATSLAGGLACDADHATDPSAAPSLATDLVPVSGGPTALTVALSGPELKLWELQEKTRVAAEQEASKTVYDSLKVQWDSVLKRHPDKNTGASGAVYCDPLGYAADVKIMGPAGGEMSIGPHKLSIPAGALESYVVITGEAPVSTAVTVRLSPHGLRFAEQPRLTLSYKHCLRPGVHVERVAYTDELLNPLEFPRSRGHAEFGLITAWLNHFSRYAVWY